MLICFMQPNSFPIFFYLKTLSFTYDNYQCSWCGPEVGTTEGKHRTRVSGKKDILTKVIKDSVKVSRAYNPVVSNIGNRTTRVI